MSIVYTDKPGQISQTLPIPRIFPTHLPSSLHIINCVQTSSHAHSKNTLNQNLLKGLEWEESYCWDGGNNGILWVSEDLSSPCLLVVLSFPKALMSTPALLPWTTCCSHLNPHTRVYFWSLGWCCRRWFWCPIAGLSPVNLYIPYLSAWSLATHSLSLGKMGWGILPIS